MSWFVTAVFALGGAVWPFIGGEVLVSDAPVLRRIDFRDQSHPGSAEIVIAVRRSPGGVGFGHAFGGLAEYSNQACSQRLFGLYPTGAKALRSVLGRVQGVIETDASDLDVDLLEGMLVLRVGPGTARAVRTWIAAEIERAGQYQLGVDDCVRFVQRLAEQVRECHPNLNVPPRSIGELPEVWFRKLLQENDRLFQEAPR